MLLRDLGALREMSRFPGCTIDAEKDDRMNLAYRFARAFGAPPTSFTLAIYYLMQDQKRGDGLLGKESEYQLARLLKGPTFLANLYYAAKSYHPEAWENGSIKEPLDLARSFDPKTLSALIALTYLYKKAKRLAGEEEWRFLGPPAEAYVDAGMAIAARLSIHPCDGMLSGALLVIAMTAFLAEDKKGFQKYRRGLKQRLYDPRAEMEMWGCTSYEVAACLLIMMGFSAAYADAYCCGFSSAPHDCAVEGAESFRRLYGCLQALPQARPSQDQEEQAALIEAREIIESGGKLHWLSRTREDAAPANLLDLPGVQWEHACSIMQQLGRRAPLTIPAALAAGTNSAMETEAGESLEQDELPVSCSYEELSDALQEQISREEFEQLKHMPREEIEQLFS